MILLLAAIAGTAAPYEALGTEPFWHLSVARGVLRWEEPGRPPLRRAVSRRRSAGTVRFRGRDLTVTVTHRVCSDGMSDRRYPDTVVVRVHGRVLNGCGGG